MQGFALLTKKWNLHLWLSLEGKVPVKEKVSLVTKSILIIVSAISQITDSVIVKYSGKVFSVWIQILASNISPECMNVDTQNEHLKGKFIANAFEF